MEESKKVVSYISLDPCDALQFNVNPSKKKTASYLYIKNISNIPVAFKIKSSSTNCFSISPSQAVIQPKDMTLVSVLYDYSETTANSLHKFLIISVLTDENSKKINWSKKPQEHKIIASINVIKTSMQMDNEEEKEQIIAQIEKYKADIEKNRSKIVNSKKLDYLTNKKIGKFGLVHLFYFFSVGFTLGLFTYSLLKFDIKLLP